MRISILVSLIVAGLTITESSHCDTTFPLSDSGVVLVVLCIDTETDGFNYRRYSQNLNLNSFKRGNIIDQTFSPTWRDSLTDSFNGSPKISWFLMTIEGYRPTSHGINAVAGEFLGRFSDIFPQFGDEIGWHYHHSDWYYDSLSHKTGWNMINTFSGRTYNRQTDRELAMNQLASFVYLNRTYPASFRAGWNWENTEFSNWLDSVIPFDYSNNWDAVDERLFMYHPSSDDLYTPGDLSRSVIRAVDAVDSTYVQSMFELAAAGHPVVLACYTHNYGSTILRNNTIKAKIESTHELCRRYSDSLKVPFRYSTASEAVNRLRGSEWETGFTLSVKYHREDHSVTVDNDTTMFGVPLVCIKVGDDIVGAFMEWSPSIGKWIYALGDANADSFVLAGVSRCGQPFTWGPKAR